MDQRALINSLKKCLKSKGITYKKLAEMMDLSEPTINRIFAQKEGLVPLDRFLKICELIEVPIEEVISRGKADAIDFHEITLEEERFLANNLPYLSFLGLLRVHKSTEKIAELYNLNKDTVVAMMAVFDKMGAIEWLPDEKFKIRAKIKFRPDGPVSKKIDLSKYPEFFQDEFKGENEYRYMRLFNFSENTLGMVKSKLLELSKEIEILIGMDQTFYTDVSAAGVYLGVRHFDPPFFETLRNYEA